MMRMMAVVSACVLAGPAAGQVYKCSAGGKVAYSDRPCADGSSVELKVPAAPPPAPAPEASRSARAARLQLEKARLASEQREARALERERRAAASQRRKCDRLRLQRKWADEDLARTAGPAADAAKLKARRRAEALAVECPA